MSKPACLTFRVPMCDPADTAGVAALFDAGRIRPEEVVAVLGKTEGNGCVNDFPRGYATMALRGLLAARLGVAPAATAHVPMVMSGGTEGGLSPHFLVFAVRRDGTSPAADGAALAIGVTTTRSFAPWELGRMAQLRETAEAVRRAMADAAIAGPQDVHLVQIKCPLLTQAKIDAARQAGRDTCTDDTYASMGFSRGASALGVAVALGELAEDRLSDAVIDHDHGLWSARASTSAGSEIDHVELIVLGNSAGWDGDEAIAHAVMQDGIDAGAMHDVLDRLGMAPVRGQLADADRARIRAVIAKAEPPRAGGIRGARHIMWDDSDINPTRHARALVGGVLAGMLGTTELFVSGGAEHQGPDGGGPVAVIASRR